MEAEIFYPCCEGRWKTRFDRTWTDGFGRITGRTLRVGRERGHWCIGLYDCIGDVTYDMGLCIFDTQIWAACLAYWEACWQALAHFWEALVEWYIRCIIESRSPFLEHHHHYHQPLSISHVIQTQIELLKRSRPIEKLKCCELIYCG